MHPILFSLGSWTLYSYGLLVAVGFASGILYASYQAKKINPPIISQDELFNLLFYSVICAVIGARLMFVIVEAPQLFNTPLDIFKIWQGGLVYYGGFIGAMLFALLYIRKRKINTAKVFDLLAPAIALGHFFGRIGCFMSGCANGKPTDLPWGVVFTDPNTLSSITDIPVHPTQLYESFLNLILFFILRFYNKRGHKSGLAIAFYLIAYSVYRFLLEFLRGDYRGEDILGLSTSQFISVFIFIIGISIVYRVNKCKK
ncbi:MAG: prolipoprotein diacylglyceryl transferase [Elusimicrobiota bacterium]|jgi:phosphatidylglycerol:prolipoprotein diacylglycerol transferase|nr:prolipoprotein diacylglyceryl transferase [Elusimicrobiota bacterium]